LTDNPSDRSKLDDMVADSVAGQAIFLPVASAWTGNGSGAQYFGEGAIAVKICGYRFGTLSHPGTLRNAGCWDNGLWEDRMLISSGDERKDVYVAVQWQILD